MRYCLDKSLKNHAVSAVLVLVFVVYNRQKERHFPKADPYDDVRENIINYDDEGGGEDDMTAFDITPLQIPIAPAIGNGGPLLSKIPCELMYNNKALVRIGRYDFC